MLDTQIVNLDGYRIVRVGDVVLEPTDGGELAIVAVDVGVGAVFGRLGWRRISRRFQERAVAWSDLHLLSSRGHRAQLTTNDATLHQLDPESLGRLLDVVPPHAASDVLQRVGLDRSTEVLNAAPIDVGGRLLSSLPEAHAAELLAALPEGRATSYRELLHRVRLPHRRYGRAAHQAHPRWWHSHDRSP